MIGIYILIFLVGGIPLCFFKNLKLSDGMNGIFFGIIISTYFLAFIYRILKDYKFLFLLDEVTKYIKDNKKLLKENPDKLNEKIEGKNKSFSELWSEYRKTLIKSEDGEYHQGIGIDRYFNEESLIYERLNLRFFNYISQSFVALGIIGTFLGLAIGLGSLGDTSIFTQSEAMMSDKMTQLLSGVTTSFYTSLYGLYYSVVYSIFLNIYLGNYQAKVSKIKEVLKFTFVGNLMEKSIENMKDGIKRIDDKNNQVYQIIISEFKKSIDEISKINAETIQNLNNEFSEKVKKIHEMIIESNEKTEKQSIETANHLNSQLEKMIETADKRQENLIENNEKMSEELKRNTLETSQIVDKQLNKTFTGVQEGHLKMFNEFSEKVKKIYEMIIESNEKTEKQSIESRNHLNSQLEKMLETADKRQENLIENNEKISEELKKNTLEISQIVDKQLNKTFIGVQEGHLKMFNEFSEKVKKIHEMIVESNEKTEKQSIESANYLNSQLEKMLETADKRQENLIENNEKISEELKKNTLEISRIVDSQLNKTLGVFSENHSKFLGEFDKLREIFKESLSNDFSKIFHSEFLNKIAIVKEQILEMIEQVEKVVIETNTHHKNSAEKNSETLILMEKINNRLESTFNKIYSSDYTDKINEIKNQLLEISDRNKIEFENYVKEMLKINEGLKSNNESNNEFNERLKEALKTITDKEFVEQIKISKENFIEVNKVSTDVLEKSFTKIGALKETIENMDLHFEKSMVILADGLEIMEEKLVNLKSLNHSNEGTLEMTQDIQKQIKKMLKNLELEENR